MRGEFCVEDVRLPEKVEKIAVVRANVLGDFIFVLPALCALKEKFPNSELVYFGNAWHKKFLENRPGPIDRVVVIPKAKGMPHESHKPESEEEVNAFFNEMHKENFDLAFQFHGGGKNSNPFTINLGAKVNVGLKTPNATPLDINVPYLVLQNEVLRYLEVAAAVGAKTTNYEPKLEVTSNDYQELKDSVGYLKKPFVVLHPGASDLRRRWPAEKFAQVGDRLSEQGYDIYVTGAASESSIAEAVVNNMSKPAEDLSGKVSLNALVALLSEADLLVSNDTGPLHVARAVGTPTVGIYWCSNMIMSGPLSSGKNRTCTVWNPSCPDCGVDCSVIDAHKPYNDCSHETSFVQSISVNEVLKHATELLPVYA